MQSKTTIKSKLESEEELRHEKDVVKMWMPYKDKVDENYKFINNNIFFKLVSNILLYGIALPILTVITKITFGFKVKGKENLKKVKGAKITVSNHVHIIDCTMCAIALAPTKVFFPTIADNFRIPVVKTLLKLLNAIPIPKGLRGKTQFIKALRKLIKEGHTLHFYPEGNLIPYDNKLENLKKGAFKLAYENNVPVVPMVFTYRKPTGFRKITNKKPLLTLNILEPIYIKDKKNIDKIIAKVQTEMIEMINKSKC